MAAILDFWSASFEHKTESTLCADRSCEGLVKIASAVAEKKIAKDPLLLPKTSTPPGGQVEKSQMNKSEPPHQYEPSYQKRSQSLLWCSRKRLIYSNVDTGLTFGIQNGHQAAIFNIGME